jgi:hypothetical protein
VRDDIRGTDDAVRFRAAVQKTAHRLVPALRVEIGSLTGKAFGVKTIGFTGEAGGALAGLCDVTIRVPATETFRVQEYHLPVYHALCAMLEAEIF